MPIIQLATVSVLLDLLSLFPLPTLKYQKQKETKGSHGESLRPAGQDEGSERSGNGQMESVKELLVQDLKWQKVIFFFKIPFSQRLMAHRAVCPDNKLRALSETNKKNLIV